MKWLILIGTLTMLASCTWLGEYANTGGSFMPTIGERCEHWQCMTASGQEQSRMRKEAREQQVSPATEQTKEEEQEEEEK